MPSDNNSDADPPRLDCSNFLILTAPTSGPWQYNDATAKHTNARNRFMFAKEGCNLDHAEGAASYLRLLHEFRGRLESNNLASDDPGKGWTVPELESLIHSWNLGDRRFRVMGSVVFPEVFQNQPLSGDYAKHHGYKRMTTSMRVEKFLPPAHILTLWQPSTYQIPEYSYSAVANSFERRICQECRKASWGVPFRLDDAHPYADYWVLPRQWTETEIMQYDMNDGELPLIILEEDVDNPLGFLVNISTIDYHDGMTISTHNLQASSMIKFARAASQPGFLILVSLTDELSPWIMVPSRELPKMARHSFLMGSYNFGDNRVEPSRFIRILKELSAFRRTSVTFGCFLAEIRSCDVMMLYEQVVDGFNTPVLSDKGY